MGNRLQSTLGRRESPAARSRTRAVIALCAVVVGLSGCASFPAIGRDDKPKVTGVQGPMERFLHRMNGTSAEADPLTPEERRQGERELQQARALYQSGDYKEAEDPLKKIAKKYKGSTIGEEAQFLHAESLYAQNRYSWAQDSYSQLLLDYPSTRYMDETTKRLFHIAQVWLDFPEVVTASDIQPVNLEKPSESEGLKPEEETKPKPLTRRVPVLPNFRDRSRPVFDTDGRALQALKSIYINDSEGPLADDALMMTASHHFRNGNFVEADRVYTDLRTLYPKSPHIENAYFLGSQVKLLSYEGAAYDGRNLGEAEQLKQNTLHLFRDHPNRDRLEAELRQIQDAEAARDWQQVVYYQKKGLPKAVATYCREILRKYPDSSYAPKAKQILISQRAGRTKIGLGGEAPESERADRGEEEPRPATPPRVKQPAPPVRNVPRTEKPPLEEADDSDAPREFAPPWVDDPDAPAPRRLQKDDDYPENATPVPRPGSTVERTPRGTNRKVEPAGKATVGEDEDAGRATL